jgi:glucose/arabinose dehydrogenase|tara:strand:- start:1179 stop:2282 length:1104 start_codon:yes stop_codon:yes gene_type:complete
MKSFKIFFSLIFLSTISLAENNIYELEVIADNLDHPWSAVSLPSGDILVTELPGNIKLISLDGSKIINIKNIPEVLFAGQGGLSDITIHPDYNQNGWIYFSYSAYSDDNRELNTLFVDRARIINNSLVDIENIFKADAERRAPVHFGAKLLFLKDRSLLITSGDGFDYRELAQKLDNHFGKIIRVLDDGQIPKDNPFFNRSDALPDIWAYGIRNPQGIYLDQNDVVFENEHGPRGGDELNIIKPGINYGWPAITYGIDYIGALISPFTEKSGMEQPIHYWTPSIAPSGMTIYEKDLFPEWKNKIFVSSLVFSDVRMLSLNKENLITKEQILFKEIGKRIRNVLTLPSGELLLITDKENGQLIRVKRK